MQNGPLEMTAKQTLGKAESKRIFSQPQPQPEMSRIGLYTSVTSLCLQTCAMRKYVAKGSLRAAPATFILMLIALIQPRIAAQSALNHDFGQVAEALTAPTSKQGLEVAFRIFSAPTIRKVCAEAGKPSRLLVQTAPLMLTVGSWFPLNSLAIEGSGSNLVLGGAGLRQ
jgi:hypothetical protein